MDAREHLERAEAWATSAEKAQAVAQNPDTPPQRVVAYEEVTRTRAQLATMHATIAHALLVYWAGIPQD